jgi:hypothetical protein
MRNIASDRSYTNVILSEWQLNEGPCNSLGHRSSHDLTSRRRSKPGASASQPSAGSDQNLAAANKIRQDLKNGDFTDIKVVAESFVVQAKSKDGNPVLMTIGLQGMSVFEAMNPAENSKAVDWGSGRSSQLGTHRFSQFFNCDLVEVRSQH